MVTDVLEATQKVLRLAEGQYFRYHFCLASLFQPPSSSATDMQPSRNLSARVRSARVRATIMPPMDIAAMLPAIMRLRGSFLTKLLSSTFTMALKTVSNASLADLPLRATSVGKATIGQEFSTSSKCWRDRYAPT